MTIGPSSPDDVFINCPFDDPYAPTFEALVFGIFACGFRPRSARELDDASQTRIEKLYGIIETCRYGIHDLSRTELDPVHNLPRFNIPFELGLDLGAKRFGGDAQKLKRCLILDVEPFRYQKFVSDLAGMDIQDHGGDPRRALTRSRDWLANVSRRRTIPGPQLLLKTYDRFLADRPAIARGLGLDADRITLRGLRRHGDDMDPAGAAESLRDAYNPAAASAVACLSANASSENPSSDASKRARQF